MRRALLAAVVAACSSKSASEPPPPPQAAAPAHQTITVAVIGGMMETGFWPELVSRFEHATGHTVKLAATGP